MALPVRDSSACVSPGSGSEGKPPHGRQNQQDDHDSDDHARAAPGAAIDDDNVIVCVVLMDHAFGWHPPLLLGRRP